MNVRSTADHEDLATLAAYEAGEPLFVVDPDGRLVFLNAAARETFGLADGAVGQPIDDVLHPKNPGPEAFRAALLSTDPVRGQSAVFGTGVPVLWSKRPLLRQNELRGYVVSMMVTIGLHREIHMRERAMEAATNGIVIADATRPEMPIIYANPAFTRITGYTNEEIIERNCRFLQAGDCSQSGTDDLRQALSEGRETTVVVRNYRKDGEPFWNELTVSPIRDDSGRLTHYLGIQNDITSRVLTERALRDAHHDLEQRVLERTEELEQANKDLEGFTYSVSHDLRAPLRAIMGFSKMLVEDYGREIDSEMKSTLDRINAAAKRMSEIIEDLLTFSRLGRKEIVRHDVDLSEISEAIATDLIRRHPERDTTITVDPGLRTHGDPTLLRLVLENLMDNAYKFTSKVPHGHVEVRGLGNGRFVVRDNGAGFEPQYKDKLFRPFERLHSASEYPGTGIGLANVRRIIERHGGQVWAEGEPGKGASFYFEL